MTKEEMMKKIEELEATNSELKRTSGQTVKSKVIELIEAGMNCIEDISAALEISSKNVSSNLTRIRHELSESGKTIVSQRINDKTMLAVVELKTLNW